MAVGRTSSSFDADGDPGLERQRPASAMCHVLVAERSLSRLTGGGEDNVVKTTMSSA
jgi:hypothetical protein